jgi:subfamily B ATP-binding cassette protein HlyB/CyaB
METFSSSAAERAIEASDALWLLSSFGILHQCSINMRELARECIPPISPERFIVLASRVGLEAELACNVPWPDQFPVAIEIRGKASATEGAVADRASDSWLILVANDGDTVTVLSRREQGPSKVPKEELQERFTGRALTARILRDEARDPDQPDGVAAGRFGFSWFVPELLKHKAIWREVLLASLVLQLIALAFPLFTQSIIDKVVVHRTQSTLIALTAGMAIFIVFTTVLSWVRQYLILHTGNRVDAVLGSHVFEHLFKLPPRYFQHRPTGVIAARMQGVEAVREFVSSAAVTLVLDLPFLLIFVGVMFWYSVTLTCIVLGVVGVIVLLSSLVAPLFQKRLNEQFLRGAAHQAFLTEYVSGLETVKSLQLEPYLNRRYNDLLASLLTASIRTKQLGNSYGTLSNGLEQTMNLLVLTTGAYLVMTSATFTVGMLVAFQMFSSRLSQPVLRLVGLWQQFQQARIAVARLGDIMDAPAEPYRLTQARALRSEGVIEIQDLAFRYADHLPYLYEGFQLKAPRGQIVAIMGPSGAGKSTLAKLLQAFYPASRGSIRIDGVDINHLSANELRSHFGVVPQETTLFSGTILENLRMAAPFASFEQVVAACRMAEIHTTIEALPSGYETSIGERGAGLSGGQKQRLAIARALLKGPRILIFDEATSNLDPSTADQIGRTINALKGKVTILFIAHALPKTLHVDHTVRIGERATVVPLNRASPELREGTHHE